MLNPNRATDDRTAEVFVALRPRMGELSINRNLFMEIAEL